MNDFETKLIEAMRYAKAIVGRKTIDADVEIVMEVKDLEDNTNTTITVKRLTAKVLKNE